MKKQLLLIPLILASFSLSAQKIEKVRKVDSQDNTVEISTEEFAKKKKHAIKLINLGYDNKSIMLQTKLDKKQVKAIRKEN
ncbi:MAG: hypothetical protein P8L23_01745 [Flavobacteriales bacterium]|nr:hypothetical protein [Flavobacteriales bacterium]